MKVLAMTKDGRMTYCNAPKEKRGLGRCNHVAHQGKSETIKEFIKRITSNKNKPFENLTTKQKIDIIQFGKSDKTMLESYINDEDYRVRRAVAEQGYGLDRLVNDEYWSVRNAVAEHGYGLAKLVDDESEYVRCTVARQGYGLDKLINDKEEWVRRAVAERKYGLSKLINDKNPWVRCTVAEQGYELDKLINDENSWVRFTVARQEYGLSKLAIDKDKYVRAEVASITKDQNILNKLANDSSIDVCAAATLNPNFKGDKRLGTMDGRLELIKEGKHIDLIRKGPKTKEIKLALIELGYDVEEYLTDISIEVQKAAITKINED